MEVQAHTTPESRQALRSYLLSSDRTIDPLNDTNIDPLG
jgi:hypothetical protein